MKKIINQLFLLLLLPAVSFAQSSISAKDIIAKINTGQAVSYNNIRIEGDLDMTQLANKQLIKNTVNDSDDKSKSYLSKVAAPLSFVNCTFTGKVLAYFNPDNDKSKMFTESRNDVYNTNFTSDVTFSGCTFQDDVAFKYSHFDGKVSFAESIFKKDAVFKYSMFASNPNFSQTTFGQNASFKYVKFPAATNFQSALFKDDADFKYADFGSKADFRNTVFTGTADFKYSQFSDPDFKGAQFNGSEDFKYTSVNGNKIKLSAIVTGSR
jgi:uncharacterized protein YjbI with pentapeptide repeats